MNYREKQYEEIFEAMLQDSLEKGLISHADEFVKKLDIIFAIISHIYFFLVKKNPILLIIILFTSRVINEKDNTKINPINPLIIMNK